MRAALLKARAKKKKFLKRQKEVYVEEDSDASLSSDDEESYSENIVGKNVNHKYFILKYLGRGTFSKVWLVLDIEGNNFYALKIQEPNDLEEMEDEIEYLTKLQKNKDTTSYYSFGEIIDNFNLRINGVETYGMVLELLGDNIGNIIGEIPEEIRLKTIKKIISQLVSGLDLLHSQGIIHTDMKVDNILLNQINPDISNFMDSIRELHIAESYQTLLQESLPKELSLLDKKKRKQIKKKIKHKIIKQICSEYQKQIIKINSEIKQNLKLEIEELDDNEGLSEDEEDNNECQDNISEGSQVDYDWDNLGIKIIDLGNSEYENEIESDNEVYTRSYRPPENIIKKEYSCKSDIWFVGCLLYELLTEEILFDIDVDSIEKTKRDKEHLKQMHQYLGLLPRSMIQNHKLSEEVIDFNRFQLEDISIREKINESFEIEENELDLIEDLMYKILEYEPDKRYSARDILNHRWLQSKY